MADLVNATHKERLSQRNSEPSHLQGGSYEDLGGTGIDSEPNSVKIDAGKGVKGQDTSIIGAGQNSEKSHLNKGGTLGEGESDDVDVKYDDDDNDVDDIDKELDQFEDVEPVDVDVKVDDDDDDEKKDIGEGTENFGGKKAKPFGEAEDFKSADASEAGENEGQMEKNAKAADDAMNSGPNKVTEGDLPPWLKKDGDKDKEEVDEDEIVIKKDDDESGEEKKVEKDEKEPEDVMDKKVEESVQIHIRRPNVKLLEAAGLPAKSQKKVALIFESVIKDVTKQVSNQIAKHYKKLHESKLAKRDAILAKQMDAYLNYVVESWVKENRVPIRTALKSQLAEEFLGAFQKMMKEHYIEVPESKVDVVKTLSQQVTRLQKSLNEQVSLKMKAVRIAEAANKGRHVAEFTKGAKLSEAQAARLKALAEDVPYVNAKDFREKLTMLTESYFGTGAKKPVTKVAGVEGGKHLAEEKIEVVDDKGKASVDPDVALIASTLKRQADARKY